MTNPAEIVTVTSMDGIPIVTLPDRRMTTSGKALAQAILAQANGGSLPPATKEQVARAVGAAVSHRSYIADPDNANVAGEVMRDQMTGLRGLVRPEPGDSPADVANMIADIARHARQRAENLPTLDMNGSPASAAWEGANTITGGSHGTGDAWVPGEGAGTFRDLIRTHYSDESHPAHKLWNGLANRM